MGDYRKISRDVIRQLDSISIVNIRENLGDLSE